MNYNKELYELKKIYCQLDAACKKGDIQKCKKAKKYLADFIESIDNFNMSNSYHKNCARVIIPPVLIKDDSIRKINDNLIVLAVKRERSLNLYDKKLIKETAVSLLLKLSKKEK